MSERGAEVRVIIRGLGLTDVMLDLIRAAVRQPLFRARGGWQGRGTRRYRLETAAGAMRRGCLRIARKGAYNVLEPTLLGRYVVGAPLGHHWHPIDERRRFEDVVIRRLA